MKYNILLKAMTPIAHGDTVTNIDNNSNIRLFMRQLAVVNGFPVRIPCISENSLRNLMFRKPLADHLTLGLDNVPKTVVNLLYSGGNLMSGAKAPAAEFTLGRELHKNYPSMELLSGSVDNFVLPSGKLRLCAWPVAKEYAEILRHVAPVHIAKEAGNVSIFDLITEETRTRGTGDESDGNQMLYTYEVMAAGSYIFLVIDIQDNASELCHSAAAYALEVFDGFIGGQSRQGRGLVSIVENDLFCFSKYVDYVEENRSKIEIGLLDGTFNTGVVLCGGK